MTIDIQPAYRTVTSKHEDEHHRTLIFDSGDGWMWTQVAPLWAAEQIEALVKLAQSVVHLAEHGSSQEQWALRGLADDARAALGVTAAHEEVQQ